jgi:OOP family OmpA-OmpF porin
MNIFHTTGAIGIATLASLTAMPAYAQDPGFYIGAGAGRSAVSIDEDRINAGLIAEGLTSSSVESDDRKTGYRIFGGYQMTPRFALEAGYFDLGRFGYTATTVPLGTLRGDMRLKGLDLDLVGNLPLFGHLSAIGRVGVTSIRASDSFSSTGVVVMPYASANPSTRKTGLTFGAGLSYDFTPALSMRVEAQRYQLNDAVGNKGHADLISASLVYRFGVTPRSVRVAEAPAPVYVAPIIAPAPAPPPPPPPAPVARVPQRFTLSADALFDFDKDTLKPAGRDELDRLAAQLRNSQYDRVAVTGHTDRLGKHDYNLKLSQRRAQAVAEYLVQGGVAGNKIAATGVDGANPVTTRGECVGNSPTPKLIACLARDRRVEIEVTGTR